MFRRNQPKKNFWSNIGASGIANPLAGQDTSTEAAGNNNTEDQSAENDNESLSFETETADADGFSVITDNDNEENVQPETANASVLMEENIRRVEEWSFSSTGENEADRGVVDSAHLLAENERLRLQLANAHLEKENEAIKRAMAEAEKKRQRQEEKAKKENPVIVNSLQSENDRLRQQLARAQLEKEFNAAKRALEEEKKRKEKERIEREKRMFNCPVCLDPFQDPRQLPCGHSFCFLCLQGVCASLGGHHIVCPEPDCRRKCTVPVDSLPINLAVKAFVLEQKEVERVQNAEPAGQQQPASEQDEAEDNEQFQIMVRGTTAGKSCTLGGIKRTTKVGELKERINGRLNMPIEAMYLTYNGKPMRDDDQTMEEYNVGRNSTIDANVRVHGGG